jgi:1-acyl-sn-glycerol-3-phosphate acyltransferase
MRSSEITHQAPTTGILLYWIGRAYAWLLGWDVEGELPESGKFILVGAPHTSNWDFTFMLMVSFIYRVRVSWLGKDSLFKRPFDGIMRWLGGIPVQRESRHGVVEQIADRFRRAKNMVLVIAPAGTRKKLNHWKSGFYWIAYSAQVPILCGALDYGRKIATLGLSFVPTGDIKADMDRIRGFYVGVQGKYPESASVIKLPDEGNVARGQTPIVT